MKFDGFWRSSMWQDLMSQFLEVWWILNFWRSSIWRDSTSQIFEVRWMLKIVNVMWFYVIICWSSMDFEGHQCDNILRHNFWSLINFECQSILNAVNVTRFDVTNFWNLMDFERYQCDNIWRHKFVKFDEFWRLSMWRDFT